MTHRSQILAASLSAFLAACAGSPGTMSEADVQAEMVGAPAIAEDERCDAFVVRRALPQPSLSLVRANTRSWVIVAYELDAVRL